MARQILPVVGAVIGAYVTGGSPQGAQWGWVIGPAIGDAVHFTATTIEDPENEPDHRQRDA
ncbi:MAG TPA: hypothetical protein VD865_02845 [Stenotrophomonas sp.]|nr:hypothetical protein [Stenotrophomonas sp.]